MLDTSPTIEGDNDSRIEPVVAQVISVGEACQMMEKIVLFEMQRGKNP
jgi:hypothetical protein